MERATAFKVSENHELPARFNAVNARHAAQASRRELRVALDALQLGEEPADADVTTASAQSSPEGAT